MTTVAEAARMVEITDRASATHQVRHVEATRTGPVAAGVRLPDEPAFYVVRKRLSPPHEDGKPRAAPVWTVVHAATTQGGGSRLGSRRPARRHRRGGLSA